MASKGRKPTTTVKASTPSKPKPAVKAPAKAAVAAKPVVKPAPAPVAVKVPVTPAPVAAKPVPVVAKIEPPAPAPVVVEAAPEPAIELVAEPAVTTPELIVEAVIEPVIEAITPVAVEAPVAIIQKEVKTMEATIKSATDKAQTLFAEANERAKAAVEKSTKLFEEANEFSKGNIEAIVESGKIAAKGLESFGQDAAEYSRKQFEGATAALKSLSGVKSPTDFFKLHSDYVRSSFDSIVAQTSKNTEAMLKLAGEVAQPISNRVAVAVEKAKIAA
ncbi:MAG: hypothetical protein JWN66_1013 [Sphingomonas bacterium]|uniref:phasin family protein n=1 Tax=Sphingomonas bacterium TaxID=1895847 RepID=UPI00263382A7|nr:phasin family protein [Sphingomonas bacterium]MDB5703897.1 hypothetical protein [Sphingomonas bacterium]